MSFIETRKHTFGVEPICRTLGVAPSSYYARGSRKPSQRSVRDAALLEQIRHARRGFRNAYGIRKTWQQLKRDGVDDVGRERVGRVMRAHRLHGVRRGRRPFTTIPDAAAEQAKDRVNRQFTAARPNELWVCDLTYVRTHQGFVYLAFVLDVYSRMIVGWQIATHMRTSLVVDALEMAHALRAPTAALVAHSDRGSQYTSVAYTERLDELGIAPSVGSKGDAYDNAMAEAFVAIYKSECVRSRLYPSFEHAEHQALEWIAFYNSERLHEQLNYLPPIEYEALTPPATVISPGAARRQATLSDGLQTTTSEEEKPTTTNAAEGVSWTTSATLEGIEGTT